MIKIIESEKEWKKEYINNHVVYIHCKVTNKTLDYITLMLMDQYNFIVSLENIKSKFVPMLYNCYIIKINRNEICNVNFLYNTTFKHWINYEKI